MTDETVGAGSIRRLTMAAALLDKAIGTSFPSEQEALALRAYSQLAGYLNSVEAETDGSGQRRRDRRALVDRRQGGRPFREPVARPPCDGQYRRALEAGRVGVQLDIRA